MLLLLLTLFLDAEDGLRPSVARLGDITGDGVDELVLAGRPRANGASLPNIVYVISGRTGQEIYRIKGRHQGFGHALAVTGDLDGDKTADFVASSYDGNSVGRALLISGGKGKAVATFSTGQRAFGCSLAGGTDLDGDGLSEILVGAGGYVFLYEGHRPDRIAQALSIRDGRPVSFSSLPASLPETPDGQAHELFGRTVAFLPDLTSDGVAEIAIGEGSGVWTGGKTWILDGKSLDPIKTLDAKGWCLATLGDTNEDGVDDFATSDDSGPVRLWSGSDMSLLLEIDVRMGGYMYGEGTSLDAIADLDNDGLPDLVVGANESWGDQDPGSVRIYSSASGKKIRNHDLRSFTRSRFLQSKGRAPSKREIPWSGADACTAGDVDGDTNHDVFIHVPSMGEIWMLSGRDFKPIWGRSVSKIRADRPDIYPAR